MSTHSKLSKRKKKIAHDCADILGPEGRYDHSDRCIPKRGCGLPSYNTESQYATLQEHLLRLN